MSDLIRAILKEIAADAPAEFPVLPAGAIEIEGEAPVLMDERAATLVIADFRRRGNDLVIDYEHQTLTGQQAPAAGWIRALRFEAEAGIVATVEWTEKAIAYLKSREYRYFSPVFLFALADRRVAALKSVALTNSPRINHLKPIIAKLNPQPKEEKPMLEKIRTILKLAADATEEKAVEAVQQIAAKLAILETAAPVIACKEVLEALGAKSEATAGEIVQIVASLKAPADVTKQLSLEVARLSTELSQLKQEDLVQVALKNGQTSPDELAKWGKELALKNPEQFKLIVLSRPVGSIVPVESLKLLGDKDPGAADEVQLAINKQMGIDPETFKKFGPKA